MRIRRSAAVLAAPALLLALTGCLPTAGPTPAPSESPISSSPSSTPESTPDETPVVEQPAGLTADDLENIEAAVNTGNTAALEGFFTDPVSFIVAASECCGPVTTIEAVNDLDYLQSAAGPWTFTDEGTVDIYRTGFYVDYFPAGAVVLSSSDADPMVLSFAVTGRHITGIFISGAGSLLLP